MNKIWVGVILVAVILAVAALVGSFSVGGLFGFGFPSIEEGKAVKVLAILPLTGNSARYAELEKQGIEFGLEEISKKQFGFQRLEVIYEDSQGAPKEAVSAFEKGLSDNNSLVVIGTLSPICQALKPLANSNKVVLMASDCSTAFYSSANDYTFRVQASNEKEGRQMAELLSSKGILSIALIQTNNDYSEGFMSGFSPKFGELGGKIVSWERATTNQKDFRTELTKVKLSGASVLLIVTHAPEAEVIVKQVREMGLDLELFGAEPIENNEFIKNTGSLAEGLIYLKSGITTVRGKEFAREFESRFGRTPEINILRTFDAIELISIASNNCSKIKNLSSDCIKEELYKVKNYEGLTGVINFDLNGDVNIPYQIKKIKDGKFVSYEAS